MIVTSNKPFSAWGEIFGDEVTAAAMIDRLVHHAEILAPKGDSYRLKDRDLARTQRDDRTELSGPTGPSPDRLRRPGITHTQTKNQWPTFQPAHVAHISTGLDTDPRLRSTGPHAEGGGGHATPKRHRGEACEAGSESRR
jgi:hypothetical protein